MNCQLYKLLLLPSFLWAGICEDNLFAHVIYGRATPSNFLDSANWDIEDGGDWNFYTYDTNHHIKKNHRLTGSTDETTVFTTVTSDSLTWSNSAGLFGIQYFSGGFRSRWNDGYGSWIQDSMWTVSDTVKWKRADAYEKDPIVSRLKIGFSTESGYRFLVVNLVFPVDTSIFECTESATKCSCDYNGIVTVDFKRSVNGSVLSDTMWQVNTAQQALYFHVPTGASIAKARLNLNGAPRLKPFFDLLGRFWQRDD